MAKVLVVGGGPAGSVAALSLRRLGHEVVLYEKARFPRYRVGESLLPGTLSILTRLGLKEDIDRFGFVKKPSATFLWGQDQAPWTFSFTTPKSAPWVFDHAIQVKRDEFDQMLLEAARRRGAVVHEGAPVRDIDVQSDERVTAVVEGPDGEVTVEADYVIDASGSGSPLVKKLKTRRYDPFYRSFAIWSYFRRADPFKGDLAGTTYSITFEHGWVWMIPLRGDVYSVGIIVDQDKIKEVADKGQEAFYKETLAKCARAMSILDGAEMFDGVRVVQDWSYEAEIFSDKRYFLCGDSACFTDPLFSQGVHLATQSAVCAAAAIDRMTTHPEERDAIHAWYNHSYRETYEQYHEFLASFYTFASFTEPESEFWRKRRISESRDDRLERKRWFERLVDRASSNEDLAIEDFRDRASTMIAIGRHKRMELSDDFSDGELNAARVRWISQLTKQLNSIKRMEWSGSDVLLKSYYKVHPLTFNLAPQSVIADEAGRAMTKYPIEEAQRQIFAALKREPMEYRELIRQLAESGKQEHSSHIVIRMMEAGLLTGYDKTGKQVVIQDRLRFDGVGEEYEV